MLRSQLFPEEEKGLCFLAKRPLRTISKAFGFLTLNLYIYHTPTYYIPENQRINAILYLFPYIQLHFSSCNVRKKDVILPPTNS